METYEAFTTRYAITWSLLMNANNGRIAAIATAIPPYAYPQQQVKEFLLQKYAGKLDEKHLNALKKVFSHPSVQRRCFALEDPQIIIDENPD